MTEILSFKYLNGASVETFYPSQYEEGIEFSRQAIGAGEDHPMASRAHVALGIGLCLKASDKKLQGDRQALHHQALKAFEK